MNNTDLVIATYNKIADSYTDRYFDISTDIALVDEFLAQIQAHGTILDVGCGPGNFTQYLVSKGFDVEGIDLSEAMLAIAKTHLSSTKFQTMDLRELTYPDQSFDAILSAYSLIHVPSADIIKTLTGFHRVLKSAGLLLIIVQKGSADQVISEPLLPSEKTFVNFFSTSQLMTDLQASGFTVINQLEQAVSDSEGLGDAVICLLARKND